MNRLTHIPTKAYAIRTFTLMMISTIFFASCKPVNITPYIEKKGDTYCVYTITQVQNTGSMQALKKGDIICLYCAENNNCALLAKRWTHVYLSSSYGSSKATLTLLTDTNISYYLESDASAASCTGCPGQNKFELLK